MTPNAYTLPEVMAVNGSDANGGCPSPCVGSGDSGITTCDCAAHSTVGTEAITGAFIDGVVPTINTIMRNATGTGVFVWAAPLFTVRGSADTVILGFRLLGSVALQEVELYLFNCPQWGIGAESVRTYYQFSFPSFDQTASVIGNVTLTSDRQSCDSLTRVSIPLQMARSTLFYFIEFHNPSGAVIQWVHIAEVRFSDPRIPMTMPVQTTGEPTTGKNVYANHVIMQQCEL